MRIVINGIDNLNARPAPRRRVRDAGSYTMGTYCEHCGYKAGSHKEGSMNCPVKGPGSGFKPDQKFAPVKDSASFADTIRKMLDGEGAGLIGGNEKPEGRHAKNTPIVADADYNAYLRNMSLEELKQERRELETKSRDPKQKELLDMTDKEMRRRLGNKY